MNFEFVGRLPTECRLDIHERYLNCLSAYMSTSRYSATDRTYYSISSSCPNQASHSMSKLSISRFPPAKNGRFGFSQYLLLNEVYLQR